MTCVLYYKYSCMINDKKNEIKESCASHFRNELRTHYRNKFFALRHPSERHGQRWKVYGDFPSQTKYKSVEKIVRGVPRTSEWIKVVRFFQLL